MKRSILHLFLGAAILATTFGACKKDDDVDPTPQDPGTPASGLTLLGTEYSVGGSMKVKLYAKSALLAEYTPLYLEVRDSASNALIETADITLNPVMDMGSMTHAAPVEQPAGNAVNGKFEGAVVFQMPGETGWLLSAIIEKPDGTTGGAIFQVSVGVPAQPRTHVVTALHDDTKLIISYLKPNSPQVGINDIEFTLHYQESMSSFPAVTDYTIEINPQMPSMGHGSPNNVHPVHIGNGHYKGSVNFTMTGLWRVNLTIKDGLQIADSTAYFDITF